MRIKLFTKYIFMVLVPLIFYSCVEEPVIEPVSVPYSAIRVGNFTINEDNISLAIDGANIAAIAKGDIMNYFDVTSGSRLFTIKDAAGNVIYDKKIDINSYYESTITFAGYYSTNELEQSFDQVQFPDGFVFLSGNRPAADSSWVYLVNLIGYAPTSPDLPTFNMTLESDSLSADTTMTAAQVPFLTMNAFNVLSGNYQVMMESIDSISTIVGSDTLTYTLADTSAVFTTAGGSRYYIYVYGEANDINYKVDEFPFPAVRSK